MRKLMAALLAGATLIMAAGSALAIPYSETLVLNHELKALTNAGATGTYTWSHSVTSDFQIPFDTVNSATLAIISRRAADSNDTVSVINFTPSLGTLDANGNGNNPVTTTFDLATLGVFSATWASGQPLELSLAYNLHDGNKNANSLTIVSSTFSLDYNNANPPVVAPVPEPGTMMLLGFGMLGLAVYGKRRMNKDA